MYECSVKFDILSTLSQMSDKTFLVAVHSFSIYCVWLWANLLSTWKLNLFDGEIIIKPFLKPIYFKMFTHFLIAVKYT